MASLFDAQAGARRKRAFSIIRRGAQAGQNANKESANKPRTDLSQKLKGTGDEDETGTKSKDKATILTLLMQAGLDIPVSRYWMGAVLLMVLCAGMARLLGQPLFVVVMAAVIGLLGLPRFILKKMAAKRQKEFLEEFPDALEATVRLLKAGMPVSEAILMISKEYEGPVGEEMSRVYDKQKIGIPLHEAAYEATHRIPLPEMKMFATGLAIQAQTGASLSEVLINLSNVIRARFRLKRKIKALSAEAVVSACIIGALPNFVAGSLYFVNREYIEILFTDSFGKVLLSGAIIWMLIGMFIMKAMINFRV